MVDPTKIIFIINLDPLKKIHVTLGNNGYYQNFIKACIQITEPMEKLLKKDVTFCWDNEFQKSLDILKETMVTVLILMFLDWKKEFNVHVDASCITSGVVLM